MSPFLRRVGPNLNWQLIVPVVSGAVLAVGLGMLVCFIVAVIGGEGAALAFGGPAAVVLPLAGAGVVGARRLRSVPLRARDGFLAVTLAWLAAAAAGAVPFMLHGTLERPLDAFFESMSGFTTTGATLVDDVEAQPHAVLLWRSLSEWIGGVGIVVLVVAIAPATGLQTQRAFYAETSGVTAERLTPRIADTAKIIIGIYGALTALGVLGYALAGMSVFDAVNHALTTISSGGFSTRSTSIGAFDSLAVELVALVLMIAAGVNFAFYWRAMRGGALWPQAAEVRLYLLIILGAAAVLWLSFELGGRAGSDGRQVRDAVFTSASVVSGTGFITADFDRFDDFARGLILLLMFVGGCAGSTSGGLKVIRVLLLAKTAGQEVQRQLQPKAVQVLRTRGRVYGEDVRRGVLAFAYLFTAVTLVAMLALLATGLDLISASSVAVATITLVGTGYGEVGGTENYAAVSDAGRVVLLLLMLAGRLEIFTVLVLFTPAFWRPAIA